jgi:hypothetical protein
VATQFKRFKNIAKSLDNVHLDTDTRAKRIEKLFRLSKETKLLVEIMDIQDELNMVKSVLMQQKDVLKKLLRLYPSQEDKEDESQSRDKEKELLLKEQDESQSWDKGKEKEQTGKHVHPEHPSPTILKDRALAHENISIVDNNIRIVAEMIDYAQKVQDEVRVDMCWH